MTETEAWRFLIDNRADVRAAFERAAESISRLAESLPQVFARADDGLSFWVDDYDPDETHGMTLDELLGDADERMSAIEESLS